MAQRIPVVLFAYARPKHLERVLSCLRENEVPLILAFADGAKSTDSSESEDVTAVRRLLRAVDWTELKLIERDNNMGLGPNVLDGVTRAAAEYDAFVVWEDDLICVPGTYAWLCAALERYADNPSVMSVTAWNHPRVTPEHVAEGSYFDRRAECWVWGTYARAWAGMPNEVAEAKMQAARQMGWGSSDYGADLPIMARDEAVKRTWASRWLYHHLQHNGLCLRPTRSFVEHIGFDESATNAAAATAWRNDSLPPNAELPTQWPEVAEHPDCRRLWQKACPRETWTQKWRRRLRARMPAAWVETIRRRRGVAGFYGDYSDYPAARAASSGYATDAIRQRVVAASRAVRDGAAAWERDTVLFDHPAVNQPLLAALQRAAASRRGTLRVVDFGGALGSVWWQHRRELTELGEVTWHVVEQETLAEIGKQEFSNESLHFYSSLAACCAEATPDVVLMSAVLAYLPDPYEALACVARSGTEWVILDRCGFTRGGGDRLTVQQVPREIYRASYPCWFVDRERVIGLLGAEWVLRDEWGTIDEGGEWFEFRGMLFQRANRNQRTPA
ncbi:methyltransferase, TIGR04325 family [Actomonas aquatica]|uniref:Methyltransferase, TIGR04325 family n=1 Tax=Actomonas aquatica TaxID=2866162 RepID=A0ABZ1CA46_9BACT|nr:methyltransferase, TIGR04325 family [Opitutus sp. WL0086]WRQ88401.1 methyltransferase, TIGR04325 family [Opitutus sp. WL0086]